MPTILPATLETLSPLIVAVIEGIVPRIQIQGVEGWKHYDKAADAATRTRRYTLRWITGTFVEGGYFGSGAVEHAASLRVRTDYAGKHETNAFLIQDDLNQLRDRLNDVLVSDISTGMVSISTTDAGSPLVADTAQSRAGLSSQPIFNTNVIQVDHILRVTYQQARATG